MADLSKIPPTPTTVSIPLRSADRTDSCPEIDRCQLEIVRNDHPDLLTIENAGKQRKLVSVGLFRPGHGCDMLIRVGLVESGGPIAAGGAPQPDGSGGVSYAVWERRLQRCIDPQSFFLPGTPRHLLNSRYRSGEAIVSLVVAQMLTDGNYEVIVSRRGAEVFRKTFSYSDNLRVTAAISPDLRSLYIVESRTSGSAYYWYSYSAGEWHLFVAAPVPIPDGATQTGTLMVDRSGNIGGFWGQSVSFSAESDTSGPACGQYSSLGYASYWKRANYDTVWGGLWSIRDRKYTDGIMRRKGVVLAAGDLNFLSEKLASTARLDTYNHTDWNIGSADKIYATEYHYDSNSTYRVMAGPTDIGDSADFGKYYHKIGTAHGAYTPPPPLHVVVHSLEFAQYDHRYGSRTIACTPGGWVSRHVSEDVKNADLSPTSWTNSTADAPPVTEFCFSAIGWLESIGNHRLTDETIDTDDIIYPIALGEYYQIHRSFSSVDQESGAMYCGAYVQAEENGPVSWHIYLNNVNITAAVAACIGRPIEELSAIYWRA